MSILFVLSIKNADFRHQQLYRIYICIWLLIWITVHDLHLRYLWAVFRSVPDVIRLQVELSHSKMSKNQMVKYVWLCVHFYWLKVIQNQVFVWSGPMFGVSESSPGSEQAWKPAFAWWLEDQSEGYLVHSIPFVSLFFPFNFSRIRWNTNIFPSFG